MKRKINKWIVVISILLFALFSAAAYLCNAYIPDFTTKTLLATIFSSLASISGVALLWEVIAKKSFSNDLYNMVQISSSLQSSGIENVYLYRDVDWKNELQETKTLKIFFAYGSTFRNNNSDELKKLKSLTVYLPDPLNTNVIDNLDYRFRYGKYSDKGEESTSKKILQAISDFKEWGAKVYLHGMMHTHTLYMLDKKCILATYKHCKSRSNVLTLKAENSGTVCQFINEEFDYIHSKSEEVTDELFEKIKKDILGDING